jgi:hypothetical protein
LGDETQSDESIDREPLSLFGVRSIVLPPLAPEEDGDPTPLVSIPPSGVPGPELGTA